MKPASRILLVEDCPVTQSAVRLVLAGRYALQVAARAEEAWLEIARSTPDLILLDINLPDADGFKLAAEIRQRPLLAKIPLIFLTGKDGPSDKVLGFTVGADDYIVKPLEPLEFRARIDRHIQKHARQADDDGVLLKGPFTVNFLEQKIFVNDAGSPRDARLTTNEFKLLSYLLRHEGHVHSREKLLNDVWGMNVSVTDRTVDSHIYSIRKKLGPYGALVQAVPRAGYRIVFDMKSGLAA